MRPGAWSLLWVCLAATAGGAPPGGQPPADPPGWFSLAVPGGTAGLLAAAGLEPTRPRTTALLDIIHVIHAERPGSDPEVDERRARVLSYLGELQRARREAAAPRARLDADLVPLPLPEAVWRSITRTTDNPGTDLVGAILADRDASLLYYGLCSVDAETRRYLAARPALVERLHAPDRAPLVALFARALKVRGNRVEPPGGPDAASLWEAVAGAPVAQPDLFLAAVLGKDGGRLALLYDAVAHMDAARQRFALGLWIEDPHRRAERFDALYAACTAGLAPWRPHEHPFARILYDPAHLLLNARVSPDGRPGPLGWRALWERALRDAGSARTGEDLGDVERRGVLDAAALLEVVYERRQSSRRDVAEAWLFGERLFGRAPSAALPDVLVSIRGFARYRSLVLTLERLGITDPRIFAAAVDRAERVTRIDDGSRTATALSLYQGALVLIERSRLARTIDVSTATRLVDSLARLPAAPGGDEVDGVGAWIDSEFLPALGRGASAATEADTDRPLELRVLDAFAGRPQDASGAVRTVDYDGTRYRIDPSGARLATILAVRERQRTLSLDAALAFSREAKGFLRAATGGAADLRPRLARLSRAAAPVLAQARAVPAWKGGKALYAWMAAAARDLQATDPAGSPRATEERAARLARAADAALGQVLVSLAYAGALPNPDSITLMVGDPSLAHDWGLPYTSGPAAVAWALPADSRDTDGRWHVRGSVLALDLCLGTDALRRLSADPLPGPPTVSEEDRRAFSEAALLANDSDYRDEDMARLSSALWRGRLRVSTLPLEPAKLDEVAAAAGLDEARRELLAWTLAREPARVARFFSLADLLRLGAEPGEPLPPLDAWGASGLSYDGRLSLRFPASQPFATLSGRRTRGLLAALLPDLALLVGELLDEQHLPAVLARPVLLLATRDYVDRLALAYDDDWMTLVADVQRIVPPRMTDYLASVTTAGPLVPMTAGTEDKQP